MNKPIYSGFSILEISKILMYESWYEYIKPKYGDNVRLCYTDTVVLCFMLKLKIFLKILLMMLKNWFDTSNYECDRPLPKG